MKKDKSLFYYGAMYHKMFDPKFEEARQKTIELIPKNSNVLDIGSGTGQLCFELSEQKQCQVVGIDLSLSMINFSKKINRFQEVTFIHEDATDLSSYEDNSFDYVTMLMVLHELNPSQQNLLLTEALRVGKKVIIIDASSPLPKNTNGIGIRIVERTFGRDHYSNFKDFMATGGILGTLDKFDLKHNLEHQSLFWSDCRQVIMLSKQ